MVRILVFLGLILGLAPCAPAAIAHPPTAPVTNTSQHSTPTPAPRPVSPTATIGVPTTPPAPLIRYVGGSTQKVCQLTAETDGS